MPNKLEEELKKTEITDADSIRKIKKRADGSVVPIKVGEFGGQGSGKTTTGLLLTLGLSVELHDRAPVYAYDSEGGCPFLQDAFDVEGVKLIIEPGESFDGLRKARDKAEKMGCCAFMGDSYTHIWRELMKSYSNDDGRVEFQDWNLIKPAWREWTVEYLNSPMHCLAVGRMSYEYKTEEKPTRNGGKRAQMVKSDSKFNAGGGESFGFEPHLLLELEQGRLDTKGGKGGHIVHVANILKDRTRAINGQTFTWKTMTGDYRKGGYAQVWNDLFPHIQKMQSLPSPIFIPPTKSQRPAVDDNGNYEHIQQRKIAVEEIESCIQSLYPGQDKDSKQLRLRLMELVFNTRSWTQVTSTPLQLLQSGLDVLRRIEMLSKTAGEPPASLNALEASHKQAVEELAADKNVPF